MRWRGGPLGLRDEGDSCGVAWRRQQARLAPGVGELRLLLLLTLQRLRAGICQNHDGEVASWAFHFHHTPSFPTREEVGLDYTTPASPFHNPLCFLFSLFTAGFLSPVFHCQKKQRVTETSHATPCGVSPSEAGAPIQLAQSLLSAPPAPDMDSDPTALLLGSPQ